MRKVLLLPALPVVLLASACAKDDDPTAVDTPASGKTARVRFFNATTGMSGSGGFTTNGQFATGSALAYGQSTQTCATVGAGSTSFGFGAANAGGTGLTGGALATLNNQSITAGGNFTVVATGSATSPQLYVLDNDFPGSLGTNQAAVRFVNLAPGPEPLPNVLNVFTGGLPPSGTLTASNVLVGSPTTFQTVTSGASRFTTLVGHNLASLTEATVNLQAGTVNTIAIVQRTASDPFQLINIPRC